MTRTALLLFPTDVPSTELGGPHYAKVTSRRGGTVRVVILPRSDEEETVTATITPAVVSARSVPRAELTSGQPGAKLFSPVCCRIDGAFKYGQITAYNDQTYVIRSEEATHEVPLSDPVETAPAVAMLLWNAILLEHFASLADLEAVHALILDRLLGLNGHRATKSIPRLLAGVTTPQSMPRPSTMVPWVCPRTGQAQMVSVGDVLNFAFYVDGDRAVPASVRVGATCFDGPATRPAQTSRTPRMAPRVTATVSNVGPTLSAYARPSQPRRSYRTVTAQDDHTDDSAMPDVGSSDEEETTHQDEAVTRFADLLNSLSSDQPAPKRQRTGANEQLRPSTVAQGATNRAVSTAEPSLGDSVQAILQVLAPYPSLLSTYAQQLNRLPPQYVSSSQEAAPNPSRAAQALVQSASPSDLIPANEPSNRRQQSFRPTRAQQDVHDAISAPAYIGKDGDVYMDHVRTSAATRFLAHPAIASRLFDIEFSVCDLSVLHFPRFDLNSQLDRSKAKATNMRNFSSKVELPELPEHPTFGDLTEALSVLYTFAKEFFNEETRDLFAAAKDFGEHLEDFAPWNSYEVHILAFWFSNVFGAYRLAVIEDIRGGTNTRYSVRSRFTMQDSELAGLLFKASRGRSQEALKPTPNREIARPSNKGNRISASRQGGKSKDRKVPPDVSALVPKKDGRQLCLRYASVQGCSSKSKDRCLQSFLAHFEPTSLPEAVAAYIRETYGGVRATGTQE